MLSGMGSREGGGNPRVECCRNATDGSDKALHSRSPVPRDRGGAGVCTAA